MNILSTALLNGVSGIILAYNHPSSEDAQPSTHDEVVTRKIKYAAECLSIKLIDHIISKIDSFSFREHGLVVWDSAVRDF